MQVRTHPLVALALVAITSLTASACGQAPAEDAIAQEAAPPAATKEVVLLEGSPANPNLSPGIRSGGLLFASGALPAVSVGPDIKTQVASALNAIKSVIEAGGSTMENVVKCTVFLTDAADFAAMNEVYVTYFPQNPPARSTVVVAALVRPEAKIEIECIAAMPR
jgi:2-iminobutanoate/2-iminopropanoate deaminase